jgi:hypothetical protein
MPSRISNFASLAYAPVRYRNTTSETTLTAIAMPVQSLQLLLSMAALLPLFDLGGGRAALM